MNDEQARVFFSGHEGAWPIYEIFAARVMAEVPEVRVKVQKTQISFYNKRLFACVSFLRVRKKKELPDPYLVVTLGLDHRETSPRIAAATEPYPLRWTHHIILSAADEVDDELMAWVQEAAHYAATK